MMFKQDEIFWRLFSKADYYKFGALVRRTVFGVLTQNKIRMPMFIVKKETVTNILKNSQTKQCFGFGNTGLCAVLLDSGFWDIKTNIDYHQSYNLSIFPKKKKKVE